MNGRAAIVFLALACTIAGCAADAEPEAAPDAGSGDEGGDVPVFHPTHCTLDSDLQARCGQLEVAESREHPDDKHILLFVELLPAKTPDDPPLAPLVVLAGGPGAAPAAYPELEGMREQRDVVLLHQRGTGLSDPRLDCVPDALTRTCAERLRARGIDLAAYDTEHAAQDVEDLRIALGVEQLDLLGLSYGTQLALEVIRRYPGRVRSAILGGTLPPQADFFAELTANEDAALDAFFARCDADPRCPLADPKQAFLDLVAQLDREPENYEVNDPNGTVVPVHVDGATIAPQLLGSMYETAAIPALPAWLSDLQTPQGRAAWFTTATSRPGPGISDGVYLSVTCREQIAFTDRADSQPAPPYLRSSDDEFEALEQQCVAWNVGAAPERVREPVRVDVPTLLISGELDPVTPPKWARLVAGGLSHARAIEVRGAGHDAVMQPCALELIAHFLADPMADPGSSCDDIAAIDWGTSE